jgi:hypothetical protein
MIRSLRRHEPDAEVWVLALSDECAETLQKIEEPGVRLVHLDTLELADPELLASKATRSIIEYYFTCTASLVCHVLGRVDNGDFVTYLDGDLYFYSSPDLLYAELGEDSVSIIPHRYPAGRESLQRYGIYNVGWLTFRNDESGRAVARWWRERCIEWCYDHLEDDRFADQKYLDRFPDFPGVHAIDYPGANLAPWNLGRHAVHEANGIRVDGKPLVFFHFHGVKPLFGRLYTIPHRPYGARLTGQVSRIFYRPYLQEIIRIERELFASAALPQKLQRGRNRKGLAGEVKVALLKALRSLKAIISGDVVLAPSERVA